MTTLICSGTLFSDWETALEDHLLTGSKRNPAYAELSALNEKICREQFSDVCDLRWAPFTPGEEYLHQAECLFSSVQSEPLFAWADSNCGLLLDFWQTSVADGKFILFYSSPENELANYIDRHPFDANAIDLVVRAWVKRTRAMLTFLLNHRENCLLVSAQSVQSEVGLFIQTLNDKFKLNLESAFAATDDRPEKSVLVKYLATTLLLDNEDVSEIFDEVRSAATILCERDRNFENIQSRHKSLIAAFLDECTAFKQLARTSAELNEELFIKQIQVNQIEDELEYYFRMSKKQGETFAQYLSTDPLLRVARQARST